MSDDKKYILDEITAEKKLKRMALEILEENSNEPSILLAGIEENGVVMARIIARMLKEFGNMETELITISLNKRKPEEITINQQTDFNNKVIILIDDVANSGKTLLYSLKPFLDSHPKKIQALAMVVRSHSSFPVRPDYAGISVATTLQEHIYVEVEGEKVKGAYLV